MNEEETLHRIQSLTKEIQPLSTDVWVNLSIEELEERLELQVLQIAAEEELIGICIGKCGTKCDGFTCGTFNPRPQ